MRRKFSLNLLATIAASVVAMLALATFRMLSPGATVQAAVTQGESAGALQILDRAGNPKAICPLKHTDVRVEISGFLSRVNVTQEFENPFKEKIEAVYVFPLPANAAVDDMTMVVGERTVRGKILRREEAQAVYEAAKSSGQVASLLNQERPNIFTQSVANILPGEKVKISISYVETLKYETGSYEFSFPMVVGPRYMPGAATRQKGSGTSPDTTQVPDASIISPKLTPAGMRAGHDISIDIMLDAGVPLADIKGKSHEVELERLNAHSAHIHLKSEAMIPNKDFVLTYEVAGKNIEDALLTHRSDKGGYFTLILQPPDRITAEDVTPKELVFVLDTSGSMSGFPIEKAKETMNLALAGLYPSDTFNLITFAGDTRILFPIPVAATPANLKKAQAFLDGSSGSGGTEMMKAIQASLDASDSPDHVRIVCFMTDGYVGNEMEIISEVQKHPNARVFGFGIGSSVNRFLLDKMSEYGRGEVEYVALNDDGSAAARRFHERVRNPLLTDISVDWNGIPVSDIYPERIPDLFGAKPVILTGRYSGAGSGVVRLKGKMAGKEFVREIAVNFPEAETQHNVLASLWARQRIDDLMSKDYSGLQQGEMKPELKETIASLGIEYGLMTQFTSFVAVEEMIVTDGGQPRRIDVPVEVPEGINREAVDDLQDMRAGNLSSFKLNAAYARKTAAPRVVSRGVLNGKAQSGAASAPMASGGGAGVASTALPTNAPTGLFVIADADPREPARLLSPAEKKRAELQAKFHPAILAVVDRLKNKGAANMDEVKFIHDGKAEIQIWLTEKSVENLAKLKELGFEVVLDPKSAKLVIGRLSLVKLEALGELSFVRYVSPQLSNN
ncbi:MAG TPA: VIT domain-containing protein [Pyrinomonadaceae bacterium]|jgi:Ca-activated chloride channel family protein|nr:VIT domain-containing protein [Pyrinomonadaceae bacterium]